MAIDLDRYAQALFTKHETLLQLQLDPDGKFLLWTPKEGIAIDLTDPSSWITDEHNLEDLEMDEEREDLIEFRKLAFEAELPDGYLPHVWHRSYEPT